MHRSLVRSRQILWVLHSRCSPSLCFMLDMLPLPFARQPPTLHLERSNSTMNQAADHSLYPPADLREDLGGFIEIAHLWGSAYDISCVLKNYTPAHIVPDLRRESGPPLPVMYILQFSLLTR
jgi:hypothetical protein